MLSTGVRWAIVLGLKLVVLMAVTWIVWPHITSPAFAEALISTSIPTAVAVAAFFLLQAALAAARWRWLLSCMGHPLRRGTVLRAWLIGQFASQALPAIIGGDATRILAIRRQDVPVATGTASVLVDRFAGFVALIVLSALSVPALYVKASKASVPVEFWYAIAIGVVLALAASLILKWTLTSTIGETVPAVHHIKMSLRQVSYRPIDIAFLAATGFGTIFTLIFAAWLFGMELDGSIDFLACFSVLPIITLLTFVPISIAGWGVREVLMVSALGLLGTPPAAALAVSVKLGLANLLLGVLGGFVWIASRGGGARRILDSEA